MDILYRFHGDDDDAVPVIPGRVEAAAQEEVEEAEETFGRLTAESDTSAGGEEEEVDEPAFMPVMLLERGTVCASVGTDRNDCEGVCVCACVPLTDTDAGGRRDGASEGDDTS